MMSKTTRHPAAAPIVRLDRFTHADLLAIKRIISGGDGHFGGADPVPARNSEGDLYRRIRFPHFKVEVHLYDTPSTIMVEIRRLTGRARDRLEGALIARRFILDPAEDHGAGLAKTVEEMWGPLTGRVLLSFPWGRSFYGYATEHRGFWLLDGVALPIALREAWCRPRYTRDGVYAVHRDTNEQERLEEREHRGRVCFLFGPSYEIHPVNQDDHR